VSQLPTVDLVVATVDRTHELDRLLASLEEQEDVGMRVIVADQNETGVVSEILARHPRLDAEHVRLQSRGLSAARNTVLDNVTADLVAFPDDDCTYPPGLLGSVTTVLSTRPELDGLVGRTADPDGRPTGRRFSAAAGRLDRATVWTCGNSASLFVRRSLVERVGAFDETLGAGSESGLQGEEIDWLIRAIDLGATLEYDPALVVLHPSPRRTASEARAAAALAGRTVGRLLRRHHYGPRILGRMAARPVGGALASLWRRDVDGARVQLATLRGRVCGYRAGTPTSDHAS
jgi:glycosyltransferase involved in cell wall biosynthesis